MTDATPDSPAPADAASDAPVPTMPHRMRVFWRPEVLGTLLIGVLALGAGAWFLLPSVLENRERQVIASRGVEGSAALIRTGDVRPDGRVELTFEYRDQAGNRREVTRLATGSFRRSAEIAAASKVDRMLIRYLPEDPTRVVFADGPPPAAPAPWVHSLVIVGLLMLSYAAGRVASLLRLRARRRRALGA